MPLQYPSGRVVREGLEQITSTEPQALTELRRQWENGASGHMSESTEGKASGLGTMWLQ